MTTFNTNFSGLTIDHLPELLIGYDTEVILEEVKAMIKEVDM